MNGLTKEKKQQIGLVAMVTIIIAAGVWFGLVTAQQKNLVAAEQKTTEVRDKIDIAYKKIKQESNIVERLEVDMVELRKREETMANGDLYQWFLTKMIHASSTRPIHNFNADRPNIKDTELIPRFPYKTATYKVKLSGFYDEVGRFLADIENDFPYARIQNLDITPASQTGEEKLNFTFEFVTLFHTNRAVSLK